MSRYSPPSPDPKPGRARWLIGPALAALVMLPLAAAAEVTLSTTVERISTAVTPPAADVASTEPAGQTAMAPSEVFSGDVLRYTIVFDNTSSQDVAAGSVVITNPLPAETVYLEGSAMGMNTLITFSVDGQVFAPPADLVVGQGAQARAATAADYSAIRWAYQRLLPAGASSQVSFELLIP